MPKLTYAKDIPEARLKTIMSCEHHWQGVMHLDGCHSFTNVYACKNCNAGLQISGERSFWRSGNVTESAMMMNDECEECRALYDKKRSRKRTLHLVSG